MTTNESGRPSATCSHPTDQAPTGLGASHFDQAQGWQPIATAPRDGTEVVLFGMYPENDQGLPTQRVTAGFWLEPDPPVIGDCGGECRCPEYGEPAAAHWCTIHGGSPGGWMSTDGGFTEEWPATHWHTLPAAPQADRNPKGQDSAAWLGAKHESGGPAKQDAPETSVTSTSSREIAA